MAEPPRRSAIVRGLESWGEFWLNTFGLIGGAWYLIRDVCLWILRAMFQPSVRLGRAAVVTQLVRVGCRSILIVMLVCAAVGFILALQMAPTLTEFGQTDKIANIVGMAVFRELGPLISAIVLTGFAGASIAAEIGTMVVGEEIEALEAHALNPIRFLVVPRVLATTIALVLLTIIGDVTSVTAGGVMSVGFLGVPFELYKTNTLSQLSVDDFTSGLIKSAVFGLILSSLACYHGLSVTGGAAGVGRATTNTVVQSIVAIILADLLFTGVFYRLDWT